MSQRRGGTIRFDDPIYQILVEWQLKEAFPSVSSLVESIIVRLVRGEPPQVPEGIDTSAAQLDLKPAYKSIRHLVMHNHEKLFDSGKFSADRLKKLMDGAKPTELETVRLALILGLTEDYVLSLPVTKNGNSTQQARA